MASLLDRIPLGRTLHWINAILVLGLLAASDPGTRDTLGAAFAIVGSALVAHALLRGPLARPGPRTRAMPAARTLHLVLHRGLLAAVVLTIATGLPAGMAGPDIAAVFGGPSPAGTLWHDRAFNLLLALAAAHIVFNFWRDGVLGEPAFRTMTGSRGTPQD